jgi:hypothetical protein
MYERRSNDDPRAKVLRYEECPRRNPDAFMSIRVDRKAAPKRWSMPSS